MRLGGFSKDNPPDQIAGFRQEPSLMRLEKEQK
jgi:hypothetical protein